MSAEIQCPKCPSKNVIFSKKRRVYICEDCGLEFVLEKSAVLMRIFLSYGHDENEELVRRIKADLEKRGHDVWFDKNPEKEKGIRSGQDWRRAITEGILKSNSVLSFLSKHSTRDPGVCRDEIAIAIGVKGGNIQTILIESEQEVNPPENIKHIQWLDMHDWKSGHGNVQLTKDQPAAGDPSWEQWYQAKLAEIIAVAESDESKCYAAEIEALVKYLKPTVTDFTADSRVLQLLDKELVGRKWMFQAVEQWRSATDRKSRLFWIKGDPGVGKSAFIAHLAHSYGRGAVIAVHFCDWQKPEYRNADRIVRTLAFQIAARLPDYRKLLLTKPDIEDLDGKNPSELFKYLLADPLNNTVGGGREHFLILIDALDEAAEAERNPLAELLARDAYNLPTWIGLVVTSRRESNVVAPLQGLNPFPFDAQSDANREDICEYLRRQLVSQLRGRNDADRLIEQILQKSEDSFLYVEGFCEDVQKGYYSLDRPGEFPKGMGGKFSADFRRYFPDLEKFRKDIRPALRAILAAREPLPVVILQRLFHWQDEELRDFTRTLGSLFPVTEEADGEVIKPYHKSLAEWLAEEKKADVFFVSVLEGHRRLVELLWKEYENGVPAMSNYALTHLLNHLKAVGDRSKIEKLWPDTSFHDERLKRGIVHELVQLMLSKFILTKSLGGLILSISFDDNSEAIRSRKSLYEIRQIISHSAIAKMQQEIDAMYDAGHKIYKHENAAFLFRYASGGTLPIVHYGSKQYFCLLYRDVFPLGWDIFGSTTDDEAELGNPLIISERILFNEVIIIDPSENVVYELATESSEAEYRPSYEYSLKLWLSFLNGNGNQESERRKLPVQWQSGPDSLQIQKGVDAPTLLSGIYLDISAPDFGIMINRACYLDLPEHAMLFHGLVGKNKLLRTPLGLFEIDRFKSYVSGGGVEFIPDMLFFDGTVRRSDQCEALIYNKYVPRLIHEGFRLKDHLRVYQSVRNRFDLTPVTHRIMKCICSR
jgi:transcription initiation factor TFIIIB Brf1 subunit/transcription initiation factor TFIIB